MPADPFAVDVPAEPSPVDVSAELSAAGAPVVDAPEVDVPAEPSAVGVPVEPSADVPVADAPAADALEEPPSVGVSVGGVVGLSPGLVAGGCVWSSEGVFLRRRRQKPRGLGVDWAMRFASSWAG